MSSKRISAKKSKENFYKRIDAHIPVKKNIYSMLPLEELTTLGAANPVEIPQILRLTNHTYECFWFKACELGHVEWVKYAPNNFDIDMTDSDNFTGLHIATIHNRLNVVKLLIFKGANMDKQTSQGNTALIFACEKGFEEIMKYLIRKGANVFLTCNAGLSCLHVALYRGHFTIAKFLLKQQNFDPNLHTGESTGNKSSLLIAVAQRVRAATPTIDIIKLLLKKGANLNDPPEILFYAAEHGHFEVFKFLVKKGADIFANSYNESLIVFLARNEDYVFLDFLSNYIQTNYERKRKNNNI
jgi:ankyrin repeat protein